MEIQKLSAITSLDEPYVFYETIHDEHYHDELELARIIDDGIVTINHIEYKVTTNDLIFINPMMVHSFQCEYKSIYINLEALGLNTMDVITKKYIYPIYIQKLIFPPVIQSYEILNIITQLFLTLDSKDELYELEMRELTYLLIHDLFKSGILKEPETVNILTLEKISNALAYIEEHYQEEISVDDLANLCNLSASHFMKIFKDKMNCGCNDYVIQYRLKKACESLIYSEVSIKDLVYQVGFRNISNFNRLFKKRYGMTPEKYRKANRQK